MTNKTIWIINQYASTPETGIGGRHYYLAKELAKQGHKVYLIAASYTHLLRNPPHVVDEYSIVDESGFSMVWIKMPEYQDAHDKKRVLNWFLYTWKLLKLPQVLLEKPDAILASSPAPFIFLAAKRLAKKMDTKLAFEVRDLWPLTLVEIGGFSPKNYFVRLMQRVEDKAYLESDIVLSNLPNAVEHMVSRGMVADKFCWIPNGIDLDEAKNATPIGMVTINNLPKNKFIVGYSGTLGVANSLEVFIEAARLLQDYQEIAFVLVGSGKEKASLMEQAKGLINVTFIDPVPKIQVQSLLSEFDVCYIGWNKEPIYRFGIAPNKLPEYMLSAKPIIHSYSGSYDVVEEACCGIAVPAKDSQQVVWAVQELYEMTEDERTKLGQNGRQHVIEHYDYARLAEKLSSVLFN